MQPQSVFLSSFHWFRPKISARQPREEPFGFDESSQPSSFPDEIDNNDNKSNISLSLRPTRPDKALRFLGAIEVGS
ncbi:hypothetical protein KY285_028851 [Solanum tuberosum]|nr:hypothetical protein KY289_029033 [Solanum tuberosum]KAH0663927.1 hypothetical protein KY284_028858 [Solanum tuberosum]KAH0667645.1 hypothetical protein KY285_028851 [Solanum tuberosum]